MFVAKNAYFYKSLEQTGFGMNGNEIEGISLLRSLVYELTYKEDYNAKDFFYYEKSSLENKITASESFERFFWRLRIKEGVDVYFFEIEEEDSLLLKRTDFEYPLCFHFNVNGTFIEKIKSENTVSLNKEKALLIDYPVKIMFRPKLKKTASAIFINTDSNFLAEYLDANIFSDDEYSQFSQFFNHKKNGLIYHPESIKDFLSDLLTQLNELPFVKKYRKSFLEIKIAELIWKTVREANQSFHSKYYKLIFDKRDLAKIEKSKEILLQDIVSPPTLTELAKLVRLNEFKLKIGFKKVFGMPPYTFLQEYKMEMARKLLEDRSKSVTEVASEIGYRNFSKFSVAFRKKFGKNPSKMYH